MTNMEWLRTAGEKETEVVIMNLKKKYKDYIASNSWSKAKMEGEFEYMRIWLEAEHNQTADELLKDEGWSKGKQGNGVVYYENENSIFTITPFTISFGIKPCSYEAGYTDREIDFLTTCADLKRKELRW